MQMPSPPAAPTEPEFLASFHTSAQEAERPWYRGEERRSAPGAIRERWKKGEEEEEGVREER